MTERCAPPHVTLPSPQTDLTNLTIQLGQAWGLTCSEPVVQYLAWSDAVDLFSFIDQRGSATLDEVTSRTVLNESGADALLCVLASVGLVWHDSNHRYGLSELAREYFLRDSPFYVGYALYADCHKSLPAAYLKTVVDGGDIPSLNRGWSISFQLRVQHSRNFAPSVKAVRMGQFDGLTHVVDIAGGSGVVAIPLALDYPNLRITLIERPEVLDDVRKFLTTYGVQSRVDLVGMDLFRDPWELPPCDGIFFGNVFHGNDDEACRYLCRNSFQALSSGGRIWFHEVLFNDQRTGPLLAALWNANMIVRRKGARQRTAIELKRFLFEAGFHNESVVPTAGGFSLLSATKP